MEVKNKRIVPTSNEILKSKSFNMETFLKFQVESHWNDLDVHRHIDIDYINYTQWAKDLGTTPKTLKKNIELLVVAGVLKKIKGSNGRSYYKVLSRFDKYKLFDERFIRKLLNTGSKNLIKVYLIYYKYTEQYGYCALEQKAILEQIGLNGNSGKNKTMLRDINSVLCSLGLIESYRKVEMISQTEIKTALEIKAIKYTETKFYNSLN